MPIEIGHDREISVLVQKGVDCRRDTRPGPMVIVVNGDDALFDQMSLGQIQVVERLFRRMPSIDVDKSKLEVGLEAEVRAQAFVNDDPVPGQMRGRRQDVCDQFVRLWFGSVAILGVELEGVTDVDGFTFRQVSGHHGGRATVKTPISNKSPLRPKVLCIDKTR